jgi:recombination protein RecA
MSALPVFAAAAPGRPFAFVHKDAETLLKRLPQTVRVSPASRLEVRPTPKMVSCGIEVIDTLTGGLPRGCLTEVCGPASSGRTSLLLAALSAATRRQEVCVLVDAGDAFDPVSARAAGVEFGRLLWVRCGQKSIQKRRVIEEKTFHKKSRQEWEFRLEQVLKTTDLLLQSGGFGLVAIDLGDVPVQSARRIPLTSWFRFRRTVEGTPTILLVIGQEPCARTCASLLLKSSGQWSVASSQSKDPACGNGSGDRPPHTKILYGLQSSMEILRSRLERKPVQPASAFTTKTAWVG